jgi:hypothetical protein
VNRPAVLLETKERDVHRLLVQLNTLRNQKTELKKQKNQKQYAEHLKKKAREAKLEGDKVKEKKSGFYRQLGKKQKRMEDAQNGASRGKKMKR